METLLELPDDLLLFILSNLRDFEDVVACSQTCSRLRQLVIGNNAALLNEVIYTIFPPLRDLYDKSTPEVGLARRLAHGILSDLQYFKLNVWTGEVVRRASAFSFSIIWLNLELGLGLGVGEHASPHVWCTVHNARSVFTKIARLNSVCWLKIEGTIQFVPRGVYEVIWHVRKEANFYLGDLMFSAASVQNPENKIEFRWTQQMQRESAKEVWVDVPVGMLSLAEYDQVANQLVGVDQGSWKSGFSVEYIELRKFLPNKSTENNALKKNDWQGLLPWFKRLITR